MAKQKHLESVPPAAPVVPSKDATHLGEVDKLRFAVRVREAESAHALALLAQKQAQDASGAFRAAEAKRAAEWARLCATYGLGENDEVGLEDGAITRKPGALPAPPKEG